MRVINRAAIRVHELLHGTIKWIMDGSSFTVSFVISFFNETGCECYIFGRRCAYKTLTSPIQIIRAGLSRILPELSNRNGHHLQLDEILEF